jgi:gamma-glutamylcyclotransferase (GGCT)/AIG2-like uncharacterized protein YtfP
MTDFFFYGTLCHGPLLQTVLGREVNAVSAVLQGYAVCLAEGQVFPVLVPQGGSEVVGTLVRGLSDQDVMRLDFYEAGSGFEASATTVQVAGRSVAAQVYLGLPGQWQAGPPWRLADWQQQFGATVVATARDVMTLYGAADPSAVQRRYGQMLVRGASRVRAGHVAPSALRHQARPDDVAVAKLRPFLCRRGI